MIFEYKAWRSFNPLLNCEVMKLAAMPSCLGGEMLMRSKIDIEVNLGIEPQIDFAALTMQTSSTLQNMNSPMELFHF